MKKAALICVALLFAFALTAKAADKKAVLDGYFDAKLGFLTGSFDGGAGYDLDADGMMIGVDYNVPAEKGVHRISVLYAPIDGSDIINGVNVEYDVDIWQISYNRLWDFEAGKELGGNFYGGIGIGYDHASADAMAAGVSVSESDSSIDFNVIGGYKLPSNVIIEANWIVDESAYGLSIGYQFK